MPLTLRSPFMGFRRKAMRLIDYDNLKPAKGIPYSKVQLWRLEGRSDSPNASQLAHSDMRGSKAKLTSGLPDAIRRTR